MIFFYLLIAALPLNEHPFLTHELGPLTIVKWLGLVCIPIAVARLMAGGRSPFAFSAVALCYSLYIGVGLTSLLAHGDSLTLASTTSGNLLSMFVLYFITISLVDTLDRFRTSLLIAIGSVAFASLYVMRQWQFYHGVYAAFRTWGGLTGDPNYYSMIAVISVPMAVFMARTSASFYVRTFAWICLGITIVGMMLAASRGGLVALAAEAVYASWRLKRLLRLTVAIVLLVLPLALYVPFSPVTRLVAPTGSDSAASESRLSAWRAGFNAFAKSPLFGVGMGRFREVVEVSLDDQQDPTRMLAHNTYLEVAVELGLVGLLPFLGTLAAMWYGLGQVSRCSDFTGWQQLHNCSVGLKAALLGAGTAAFFLSAWWLRGAWLVPFLGIALTTTIRRSQAFVPSDIEVEDNEP